MADQVEIKQRASKVTYRDVDTAAQVLFQNGKLPSVRSVHAELGRGSHKTIGNLLRIWRSGNSGALSSLPRMAEYQPLSVHPEILTREGRTLNLLRPTAFCFSIAEIAEGLANICLCTSDGHPKEFYPLAQHALLRSFIVPRGDARVALLYESSAAFIGYVPKTVTPLLPDYRALANRVESAIFAWFGLPGSLPATLLAAEEVLRATELRDLLPGIGPSGRPKALPMTEIIMPMNPAEARKAYLQRWDELGVSQ